MGTATAFALDDLLGAVTVAGTVALSPLLAPWYRRWGATDAECAEELPGDALVPRPRLQATRATDIGAPPEVVWSWLIQMGHGRAGLYSYEGLENLAGCDLHNADRIEPAWQHLALGDSVALGPPGYPSFAVVGLVRHEHLVLLAGGPVGAVKNVWCFVLRPRGATGTRLIVRSRYEHPDTASQWALWRLLTEPMHFVMERKMLQGLRDRAERSVAL